MHDLKVLRAQPLLYKKALMARGQPTAIVDCLLQVDATRRQLQAQNQERRELANLMNAYTGLSKRITANEVEIAELEKKLFEMVRQ